MVVFQALTWEARDEDDEHLISILGKTEDGKSVCVTTPFKPYFFIKLPDTNVHAIYKDYRAYAESYELLRSKDVWGFQNNEKFPFMKLNFRSLENMRIARITKRWCPNWAPLFLLNPRIWAHL